MTAAPSSRATTTSPTRARLLRDYGERERYESVERGWNSRLDTLQAAVLSAKLAHLDDWNVRRREIAASYGKASRIPGSRCRRPTLDTCTTCSSSRTRAEMLSCGRSPSRVWRRSSTIRGPSTSSRRTVASLEQGSSSVSEGWPRGRQPASLPGADGRRGRCRNGRHPFGASHVDLAVRPPSLPSDLRANTSHRRAWSGRSVSRQFESRRVGKGRAAGEHCADRPARIRALWDRSRSTDRLSPSPRNLRHGQLPSVGGARQ